MTIDEQKILGILESYEYRVRRWKDEDRMDRYVHKFRFKRSPPLPSARSIAGQRRAKGETLVRTGFRVSRKEDGDR